MAGQAEQAARTDISPLRSWIVTPDRDVLGAGVRDDHGTGLCPQRADRAGTSPWRSDTARGTGEGPRVGCASIYRYRLGEWKGGRA